MYNDLGSLDFVDKVAEFSIFAKQEVIKSKRSKSIKNFRTLSAIVEKNQFLIS
jgi:hypothetical protein